MLSEDGTRILMGDCNYGGLFLLTLIVSGRGVDSMSFVKLGTVSDIFNPLPIKTLCSLNEKIGFHTLLFSIS